MSSAQTRATIEQYINGWASGDHDTWIDTFAEDAVFIDPVGTPAHAGRAAISKFWDKARSLSTSLTPEVDRIVACGDRGVLVFTMHAKFRGGGMDLDVVDVFEMNADGKIAKLEAFWDRGCQTMVPDPAGS